MSFKQSVYRAQCPSINLMAINSFAQRRPLLEFFISFQPSIFIIVSGKTSKVEV